MLSKSEKIFVPTVYFLTYWHLLVQTISHAQCTHDKLTSLSGNRKFVQFCIGLVVLIYLLNLYLVFTDSKIWFLKPLMDFYFQKEYENTWNCFVKLKATFLQNLSLSTFCQNLHDLFEHAIYAWLLCFNYGVKFLWPASVVFYGQELVKLRAH